MAIGSCSSSSSSSSTPAQTANHLIQSALKAQSKGNRAQAVKDLQAAIAANPANAIAYYDLGVIYQQANDANDAIAQYHKALLANPNYKPALFNLAISYTTSDPGQAISLYNQLLALNPNDANVLFNLGLLLIANNQSTDGHADLKKAIALSPALASRVPSGITP
jgi:Tfp pilus assembly protein PilF